MKNNYLKLEVTIILSSLIIFYIISLYLTNTMYVIFYSMLFRPLFLALIIFYSANSIGHLLFSRIFRDNHTIVIKECLFTGFGLIFLIYLTIILGALSIYKYSQFPIILIIICALSYKRAFCWFKELKSRITLNFRISEVCIISLIIISALLHIINSLSPPIFYDALEYHLAIPEKYLEKGGFHFIQNNVYSNFPFNIEMLYLIGLQTGKEEVPKLINLCFYLLNLFTIYSICHYLKMPRLISLLAVLLFSTFFITNSLTLYCYIELGITFFVLLLFYTFLHWTHSRNTSDFVSLSILSGIIIGCKYTTLLTYFIPFLTILIFELLSIEQKKSIVIKKILLFISISILIFSPWIIKNLILTGNPVYPLLYLVFGGKDWSIQQSALFTISHQPHNIFSLSFLNIIISRIGVMGYFYFILILISFLMKSLAREIKLIGIYLILSFLFWNFLTQGDSRFFAINSPLAIILGVYVLYNLILFYFVKSSNQQEIANASILPSRFHIFTFFFILQALLGIADSFLLQDRHNIHRYFTGKIDEFEYKTLNIEGYPALVKYLNESTPSESKCIFLYEGRTFGIKRDVYYNTIFDQNHLMENLRKYITIDELKDFLKKEGIIYIVLNESERDRFKDRFYGVNYYRELSNEETKRLNELLSSLKIEKIIVNGDNPSVNGFRIVIYKVD